MPFTTFCEIKLFAFSEQYQPTLASTYINRLILNLFTYRFDQEIYCENCKRNLKIYLNKK